MSRTAKDWQKAKQQAQPPNHHQYKQTPKKRIFAVIKPDGTRIIFTITWTAELALKELAEYREEQ